jgi:hypothetical protein
MHCSGIEKPKHEPIGIILNCNNIILLFDHIFQNHKLLLNSVRVTRRITKSWETYRYILDLFDNFGVEQF